MAPGMKERILDAISEAIKGLKPRPHSDGKAHGQVDALCPDPSRLLTDGVRRRPHQSRQTE